MSDTTNDLPADDPLAMAVRLQNRNTCELCPDGNDGELQVHRIVDTEDATNLMANYMVLCPRHHEAASGQHCFAEAEEE